MEPEIVEVPNENEIEASQETEAENEADVESTSESEGAIKQKTHFTGTVTKIGLAGALVEIGVGKPGVMHISQIIAPTDEPIKRVGDVLQIGQSIDVWVKRVKDGRVELTMIKPLDLDWRDIKKGMTVKGKVVRLEKFGAFVEIGAERPGLIHISEMAHGYVRQPTDVVNEGDDVEAQVIDVNRKKRQIKLSIKALLPEPVKEELPLQEFVEPLARREKTARPKKVKKASRGRGEEGGGDVDELMAALGHSEGQSDSETAMAIAWKEAMEKAKARKQDDKSRKNRGATAEQEDILSRTLGNKVKTSA